PNEVKAYADDNGGLLLTGFFAVRDDAAKQCQIIKQVAADGHAALVLFYVGAVVQTLDKAVIEAAEAVGLPLIVMPKDSKVNYSDVITQIMEKVLYSDNFSNRLISNTIFHLLNFEKHSSFQAAVREAAINNDFQLILLSEDFNPILSVETRHKVTIADAIRMGRERAVEQQSEVYTMVDVNGVLTYWGPVTINTDNYFMLIVDNEDSYSADEITKLAEIIELAMGMWKYTPERDARAEFIKALIRGNKSLAYTLKDEAGIEGEDILSVFFAKGINQGILTEFERQEGLHIMKISEGDETYGMILQDPDEKDVDVDGKITCVKLFNKLKEDKSVRIFHVTGLEGIEGAGDAFRLISESWSFVQNVFPYKRVFTKYELALVSNCINIQLQGGYVKKNYAELLEPFKGAGENKGKQLLETLETFVLDAGMNSSKTAEFMSIHTNTVQYRLKRINDVLGVEITGNRVIPGLTISLALKRLERVVS
ncbi:MAG: PucR family transcriptional regulator ligand-binding domain-containing protein, partial [Lachnospiraceae bacterium]|nr:PucR family transcriptional regulator ligand-binding domain-containing protein [Lachnospiraceae bacterium]